MRNKDTYTFIELYNNIYTMVVHGGYGGCLYNLLKKVLITHLETNILARFKNNDFLQTLNVAWRDYQTSLRLIENIFCYMEKNWIPKTKLENIQTLGMNLFRDLVMGYGCIRQTLLLKFLVDLKKKEPPNEAEGEMLRMLGLDDKNPLIIKK